MRTNDEYLRCIIKRSPHKILDLHRPTEDLWILAIQQKLNLFTLCKEQTEKIQLQAVSGNGKLIIFCKNPSKEVWKKAILQNPYVIENLEEYDKELIDYALSITPKAMKCIKNFMIEK